jgi:hypothetical protein
MGVSKHMHQLITPAAIISAILFGLIATYFAIRRKRNPYLWFVIGFFFGMIGLFAIFLSPSKKKTASQKNEPSDKEVNPLPIFPGPLDKFWYYLDPSHQQIGPMSHSAIEKALHQGLISQTTYVWNEDMSDWKKIEELCRA